MIHPFSPKEVPERTQRELEARSNNLIWSATRFPWVHVQSFSSGCSESYRILKSFGGPQNLASQNQTIETAYSSFETVIPGLYETNFSRPRPVITEVKVKKRGELGSTREVSISFLAFTDAQLGELQKCHFIPGMTIRVQFGWSVGASNGAVAPQPYTENPMSDAKAICAMTKLSADSAVYEGMQGIVTNFTYNLTPENFWQCTVTMTSVSDTFVDAKVTSTCCPCPKDSNPSDASSDKPEDVPDLLRFFIDIGTNLEANRKIYQSVFGSPRTDVKAARLQYEGLIRNPNGSEPSLLNIFSTKGLSEVSAAIKNLLSEGTKETFISFGALEEAINKIALPLDKFGKNSLGQVKSTNILIKSHPLLESADPRVCILFGTKKAKKIVKVVSGDEPIAYTENYVRLSNIMINTVFLASVFKQSGDTVQAFLQTVLNEVSRVCGSLWSFEVVSTTEFCDADNESPTISIVDQTVLNETPSNSEFPRIFSIPTNPNNSVVRDVKLDLKLTDSMKTQALYSNRQQSSTSTCDKNAECNGVVLQPFGLVPGATVPVRNTAIEPTVKKIPKDCECTKVTDPTPPETVQKTPKETYDEAFAELFNEDAGSVDDTSVNNAIKQLVIAYSSGSATKQSCSKLVLPLEFSFTVDGIGGFKFGQTVTSTRIPQNIRDQMYFQVTAVEHTLTPQDWTTTVNTVARFRD